MQGETNTAGCRFTRGNVINRVLGRGQGAVQHLQLAVKLRAEFPDNDIPVLIEATQYCKEKQIQQAVDLLEVML